MIRKEWLTEPWTRKDEKRVLSTQSESLCTTRFNNKTYDENKAGKKLLKTECFYANPCTIKNCKQMMYVLELNVEENKIMGIGRVPNVLHGDVYKIYEDESYNKRYFSGGYRINLEDLNTMDEKLLIATLEDICFKGRGHLKRGHRMLGFPKRILGQCLEHGLDIVAEIRKIFVRKYPIK